jgi:diguanylate cyclase (GGDEF)-like protein
MRWRDPEALIEDPTRSRRPTMSDRDPKRAQPSSVAAGTRRRHSALLLALLALIVTLSALLVRELIQAADALVEQTRRERETLLFLDQIEGLFAAVKDAESALRGQLLTGESVFRDDYLAALPRARQAARNLRQNPRVELPDQSDLRSFLARVESRIGALERVERAHAAEGPEAAVQLLRSQVRSEAFGAIRMVKEDIEQALLREVEDAQAAERQILVILRLASIGIGANLLLVLMLAVLVARQNRQRGEAQRALTLLNRRIGEQLESARRLGDGLARLGRLGQVLQSSQRFEEALSAIELALPPLLADTSGQLYLYDASRSHLESRIAWGEPPRFPVFAPEDCWALRQGRRHDCGHGAEAPRCAHLGAVDGQRSVCLTLIAQGSTLGILHIAGNTEAIERCGALLEPVAEQVALALSNLQLRESLRTQSIRDPLTGLYNRRYLEASFERELARARRRGTGLALIAFDIDHFKRINDSHGHAAGDAVLEAFGDLLLAHARREDLPCRLGGEEFVLLLPETDLDGALRRAESVRAALASLAVEHLGRSLGKVTLSAGVAAFPEHGDSLKSLLAVADAALYAAKRSGRDRVEAGRSPVG